MSVVITGTYDIECEGWDKFVIGGCYDGKEYHSFRTVAGLLDYMIARGGVWWGHYSGAYDMLCLLAEHAERKGSAVRCYMAGSRITCALFGRNLTLRDSFAIAPIALSKFAKIVNLEKSETGLPCICAEKCAGYCAIQVGMPEKDYRLVDSYMENDCVILYKALTYWIDYLRHNFSEPKGTIGATSFHFTGQVKAKWKSAIYDFVRKGYYGGRTEAWKQESVSGWHDDINSAYVDALRLPMPTGEPVESYGSLPDSRFYVTEAIVSVPDMHIPSLPRRGKDRLYFPVGRFFGTWNKPELEAAVNDGATVHKVGRAVTWPSYEYPYVEFCNHVWNLRSKSGKKTTRGKLLKNLSVAVAGKLAQRPEIKEVVYSPVPLIGWKSLNPSNQWWYREKFKIADCAHVHHAGTMTAHVRIRVRRRGDMHGAGAVYCDTDGVFGESNITEGQGAELGEWEPSGIESGHDGSYRNFRCHAPKLYEYEETEIEYRAKGFSLGADKDIAADRFRRVVSGDEIQIDRGVRPLLRALRARHGKIFQRRKETRSFHRNDKWIGGRLRVGHEYTQPPTLEDINERTREQFGEWNGSEWNGDV